MHTVSVGVCNVYCLARFFLVGEKRLCVLAMVLNMCSRLWTNIYRLRGAQENGMAMNSNPR